MSFSCTLTDGCKKHGARLILLMASLLAGCASIPEGFTSETWERLQREDPRKAEVVQWIHASPMRRELRHRFLAVYRAQGQSVETGSLRFEMSAEGALRNGHDLRKYLLSTLEVSACNPGSSRVQDPTLKLEQALLEAMQKP